MPRVRLSHYRALSCTTCWRGRRGSACRRRAAADRGGSLWPQRVLYRCSSATCLVDNRTSPGALTSTASMPITVTHRLPTYPPACKAAFGASWPCEHSGAYERVNMMTCNTLCQTSVPRGLPGHLTVGSPVQLPQTPGVAVLYRASRPVCPPVTTRGR